MDSSKELELKSKSKKSKGMEKSEQSLNDFLNQYKGIEALWKNVEKNKNASKNELRGAEMDLVDATEALGTLIGKLDENNKKKGYDDIIKEAYGNNLKGAEKFIEKFPNWSIAIGTMWINSPHYKRILQLASTSREYKDIISESNFKLKRTGKGKIKADGLLNKIKSGWKSLKTAFSNYIKPDDIGKASKSSLARRIEKFGKEVNRPWRMWWDFAAGGNIKLSKDVAKTAFKEALKKGSAEVVSLFNFGTEPKSGAHGLAINTDEGDYRNSKEFMQMNIVVKDLDKNLLEKVQAVFQVSKEVVESNIKNGAKITASRIFQNKIRKPEDYKKFFDILGIKEYCDNKNNDDIIKRITELLTEIEGEEKAKGLAGDSNANINNFLQLARANFVIKDAKMEDASQIAEKLSAVMGIFNISGNVDEKSLLNTNGNEPDTNTKKLIGEIEKNDANIAKKFNNAIDLILKPTTQQSLNIENVKNALKSIKTDVDQQKKLTTEDEVNAAIGAIATCKELKDEVNTNECSYDPSNGRKKFLADVAVRLGVRGITENNVQNLLCKSKANLQSPYNKMSGAILVQRLRNLIAYGLGYGTNTLTGIFKKHGAESLPDLNNKELLLNEICAGLGIKKK